VSDYGNNVVRKISSGGIITTIGGMNSGGFSGDGGPATSAQMLGPSGIISNPSGTAIFFTDQLNSRIRSISNVPTPDICMVTVDSLSQNNIIIWDKTSYLTADSFIVYRETNSSPSIYSRIASISKDSLSQYIDTVRSSYAVNGDPNITTYRYKLQLRDIFGNYSFMSNYHNSIYVNNSGSNFSWNSYVIENNANPVSYYRLLRDDFNNGNWSVVGTTAGTQTNLNDPNFNAFQNTANWRVETVWGINCTPTMRMSNPSNTQTTVVKSKSNISNNRQVNISTFNKSNVSIYPVPASDVITIQAPVRIEKVHVFDLLGNKVLEAEGQQRTTLDVSGLPAGYYEVRLICKDRTPYCTNFVKQ
jgi:hypothetical protein